MVTDYNKLLRLHAARWSVLFTLLILAWLVSWMASFTVGDFFPTISVSLLLALSVVHCRIRYRYLLEQRDEALIARMRRVMQDAGEI